MAEAKVLTNGIPCFDSSGNITMHNFGIVSGHDIQSEITTNNRWVNVMSARLGSNSISGLFMLNGTWINGSPGVITAAFAFPANTTSKFFDEKCFNLLSSIGGYAMQSVRIRRKDNIVYIDVLRYQAGKTLINICIFTSSANCVTINTSMTDVTSETYDSAYEYPLTWGGVIYCLTILCAILQKGVLRNGGDEVVIERGHRGNVSDYDIEGNAGRRGQGNVIWYLHNKQICSQQPHRRLGNTDCDTDLPTLSDIHSTEWTNPIPHQLLFGRHRTMVRLVHCCEHIARKEVAA